MRMPMPEICNWHEYGKKCTIILDLSSVENMLDFFHATCVKITYGNYNPLTFGIIKLLKGNAIIEIAKEAKLKGFLEIILPILITEDIFIEIYQLAGGYKIGCKFTLKKS